MEKKTKASLRISTVEYNADFISDALGVDATKIFIKGDTMGKRPGVGRVRDSSLWLFGSSLCASFPIEEHISFFLTLLEARATQFSAIRNRIQKADIFCMYSSVNGQGSLEIKGMLLERLARQKIDLTLDLYPPS